MNKQIGAIFAILGILILIGFASWIVRIFDVPFAIAGETVIRLVVWTFAATFLIFWHFKSNFDVIKNTFPLILSLFWSSLFPILDYTAGVRENFPLRIKIDWYGNGFWQIIIFLAINVIGYFAIYLWNKRTSYY
ncbi:hypothetical protein PSI19_18240 [Xenorhabdus khoisanae]|uniref:hypothetical protein n=1 Tax=Xenorhabdus khoisanae TaxID=880157 RepID=UPI0023589FBA|nr:hypothetical protein [Xenorhabdus khoisanae]MDC9615774.1 hypothetical protein [Xenorhabdus khoisanae]